MYEMTTACTKVLWNALASSGVRLEGLSSSIASIPADLAAGKRIQLAVVYELFGEVERITCNPDVGLIAYGYAHPTIWHPFMYCLLSAPTLGVALERMVKYHSLISQGTHLFVDRGQANTLRLCGLELGPTLAPRSFIDAGAVLILALLRWLGPNQNITPLRIELTYPSPSCTNKLVQYFGPRLMFGASSNSIFFCASILEFQLPSADEALDELLVEHADLLVQEMHRGSTAAKVRRYLIECWSTQGHGRARMTDTAEHLCISVKLLRSSLAREATNFKEISDECRLKLAYNYLRKSTRSLKYIALTLGFSDLSSFHKACLRWFKMSPDRFRNFTN